MRNKLGVVLFAATEIFIGVTTLTAVIFGIIQRTSTKPLEVVIFVLATSVLSTSLGFVILKHNSTGYRLLLFFSKAIILSKILIFAKIISLNGALETTIPSSAKNFISIVYHSLLIFYFTRRPVKEVFK